MARAHKQSDPAIQKAAANGKSVRVSDGGVEEAGGEGVDSALPAVGAADAPAAAGGVAPAAEGMGSPRLEGKVGSVTVESRGGNARGEEAWGGGEECVDFNMRVSPFEWLEGAGRLHPSFEDEPYEFEDRLEVSRRWPDETNAERHADGAEN